MREILFRGKTNKKNEWVYGSYIDSTNDTTSWYVCGNYHRPKKDKFGFILERCLVSGGWFSSNGVRWCLKETIGQYTGLKDKNDNKIFEGDIVKAKYKENREYMGVKYDDFMEFTEKVVWHKAFNCFCLEIDNEGIPMFRRLNFVEKTNNVQLIELEVIGNVWDNPKLLEEE